MKKRKARYSEELGASSFLQLDYSMLLGGWDFQIFPVNIQSASRFFLVVCLPHPARE